MHAGVKDAKKAKRTTINALTALLSFFASMILFLFSSLPDSVLSFALRSRQYFARSCNLLTIAMWTNKSTANVQMTAVLAKMKE